MSEIRNYLVANPIFKLSLDIFFSSPSTSLKICILSWNVKTDRRKEIYTRGRQCETFFSGAVVSIGGVDTLIPFFVTRGGAPRRNWKVRISGFRETWSPRRPGPVINERHAFDWAWLVKRDSPAPPPYIPWSEQIYLELSWNAASKVIFVARPPSLLPPSLFHDSLKIW